MTSEPLVLDLPPPISANRIWTVRGKGIGRTKAYDAYLKAASWEAKIQAKSRRMLCPYRISIALAPIEGRTRHDLDNGIKATSDALVMAGIINDAQCEVLEARWVPRSELATGCRVTLVAMDNQEANAPPPNALATAPSRQSTAPASDRTAKAALDSAEASTPARSLRRSLRPLEG